MGVAVDYAGPDGADVFLIGDFPEEHDEHKQTPFSGTAGVELTKMLQEAGFLRAEIRLAFVSRIRPYKNLPEHLFGTKTTPDSIEFQGKYPKLSFFQDIERLKEEVRKQKPKLIIACGNLPLWVLTGNWGITDWRGSVLEFEGIPIVATYSPSLVIKNWEWRFVSVHDFRRAGRVLAGTCVRPSYALQISPSFSQVTQTLGMLIEKVESSPTHLSVDIETYRGHIACIGIAWSRTEAISIPFTDKSKPDKHYWSEDEEAFIRRWLAVLLTHENCKGSGQNWLYDAQYFAKHLGFEMNLWRDTMTQHHVLFAGLPNSLAFQASLYLDWYCYWKDDGKEQGGGDQLQWWEYNCIDCCNTFAIAEEQTPLLEKFDFTRTSFGSPSEIQQSLHDPVFSMMLRGVRVDEKKKRDLVLHIMDQIALRETWLQKVVGKPINPRSPKQLQDLFYEEFRQKKIYNYKAKTKGPTTNADALITIAKREPLLAPLVETINEVRELSNARAFCAQQLDLDKRIRCSYNISGTETYRFASSEDAFGFGTNLQNVTQGYSAGEFSIPNLRELFIPDVGFTIGEFDLSAADAQVVAADAGDWELLEAFQTGADLHTGNAKRWSVSRPIAKGCLHATNYVASARALSLNFGISIQHGEFIINDWYAQHPKIKDWHDKILMQLMTRRYVENAYGYRRFYFGRIDTLLKEAVAWIPQSTVAIVTNLGLRNIYRNLKSVQLLLQTHDSATVQWPASFSNARELILEQMRIPIPYPHPLTIPVGVKTSMSSWGQVK
jgi:uracil-DNA glycosylase family 4